MRKIFGILLLLTIFSCKDIARSIINNTSDKSDSLLEKDFNKIKINDSFDISVPKYMKKMDNLNEDASLQYANLYKEAYVVVTVEDKNVFKKTFKSYKEYDTIKSLIDNYKEVRVKMFKEIMKVDKIEHYSLQDINGYNARQFKIEGTIDNVDIFYLMAVVETDEDLYLVMNWTLLDRSKRFENTFETMTTSFNKIGKEIQRNEIP